MLGLVSWCDKVIGHGAGDNDNNAQDEVDLNLDITPQLLKLTRELEEMRKKKKELSMHEYRINHGAL